MDVEPHTEALVFFSVI